MRSGDLSGAVGKRDHSTKLRSEILTSEAADERSDSDGRQG